MSAAVLNVRYNNIQFGCGRNERIDLDRFVKTIERADISALQEVDRHWSRPRNIDEVRLIFEQLPGFDFAYGVGVDQAIPSR